MSRRASADARALASGRASADARALVSGHASDDTRALELAYRFVSRRERTTHELRQHLLGRDVDESAVAAAVQELTEVGYLDDARFARLFVQDKRELEQWGRERIRRGLLARGIDSELAELALAEETSGSAEEVSRAHDDAPGPAEHSNPPTCDFDRAIALLRRRFPDLPPDRREQRRALGVLLRRGYEPELAMDAVRAHSGRRH